MNAVMVTEKPGWWHFHIYLRIEGHKSQVYPYVAKVRDWGLLKHLCRLPREWNP